jgi:hypothetical protein
MPNDQANAFRTFVNENESVQEQIQAASTAGTLNITNHGIPENPYNPYCWITGKPDIGEQTWIGAFTLIDGLGGLKIGRGCDISSGAQILTHSTVRRCLTERQFDKVDYRPPQCHRRRRSCSRRIHDPPFFLCSWRARARDSLSRTGSSAVVCGPIIEMAL